MAAIFEQDDVPQASQMLSSILEIFFLSMIGSILGTLMWFRVLERLPANSASSFFLLTPLMGIAFGSVIFGEPVTSGKILGIALISSAILLRVGDFRSHIKSVLRGCSRNTDEVS